MPDNKKRIPIGVRFLLFYFLLFCKSNITHQVLH